MKINWFKPTFLTKMEIDMPHLVSVLKNQLTQIQVDENKKILKTILDFFEKNDFSLLSSQEIYFLKNSKEDIWADYLIFRYKFNFYPKLHIVSDFPNYISIEPVSACNLRCVMCYQSDNTFTGNQTFMGMMKLDLFKKIIDEASSNGTKAITLASRGEPTLHPQLSEMLEYCSGKFLEIKLNTNATKLTEKLIHKILQSGITDIVFSVDSYTKENYEKIRLKGIFDEVLNNIKKFKEIKDTFYPDLKIATRVSGVQVDKNQDPELFKNFWEKHVDHVVMVPMSPWWDTYNNSTSIAGKDTCGFLWQRINIWYDGKCNPCDTDYKSTLCVGDLNENSIKEIWHSEKYTKIRDMHLTKNRQNCYPCDRCPFES